MSRFIPPFADVGKGITPSSGAKYFFFESNTSNPKNTYADQDLTTPNTNPVISDSNGLFPDIWLEDGEYLVRLTDKNDVQRHPDADPVGSVEAESFILNIDTVATAIANATLSDGDALNISERTTGAGGGGIWDVVLTSTVTPNGINIIQSTATPALSIVTRDKITLGVIETTVGQGTGARQPNCAFQSVRDAFTNGSSWHGFVVSDKFAVDGSAENCFGSDVEIGDGTHTAPFLIDHVNSFQSRNIMELGLGSMTSHGVLTSFDELRSGTLLTHNGAVFQDVLGGFATPGLNIPNFEVNGPAQVNSQTGIRTAIKHGLNPRSAFFGAGTNDAGASVSTGGGVIDCECPITVRQVEESTSPTSGAIKVIAGGMGAAGNITAGGQLKVHNATPSLRLNSVSATPWGSISHDGTDLFILNQISDTIKFGSSGAVSMELKIDRLIPTLDDALFCGDSGHRWKQLFAVTATIGTSDMTLKNPLGLIDDTLLDAWGDIQSQIYTWKDAVTEKGDGARLHVGYMAQEIEQALNAHGLDAFKYGLLCKDELTEDVIRTKKVTRQKMEMIDSSVEDFSVVDGVLVRSIIIEQVERGLTEEMQVMNSDGSPYLIDDVEVVDGRTFNIKRAVAQEVPVMEEYDEEYTETVKTGKYRYGLRYEECLVVETAYLRRELKRLAG